MSGLTSVRDTLATMPHLNIPTNLGNAPIYESRRSDSLSTLATALVLAQQNLKPAPKDSDNPFFKSRYADLTACMEAVKDAYNAQDISIIQRPLDTDGTTICIETILLHSSGEYISGILRLKPVKADPQGLGSCLTYARRYALGAITGLVTEEDDDGNAASQPKSLGPPKTQSRPQQMPASAAPPADIDLSWIDQAGQAWLKTISKSPKLTAKGQPFGDLTFDLGDGKELTVTWFGFSGGWTFETLRDSVCGTDCEVYYTVTPPSNPKYKPTLEHFHVAYLTDPAE